MKPFHSIDRLQTFSIVAIDGELGSVKDVYFDDQAWVIRYLVMDTGMPFTGRRALISPVSVLGIETNDRSVHLSLTKDQLNRLAVVDATVPVFQWQTPRFDNNYGVLWNGTISSPAGSASSPAWSLDARECGQTGRQHVPHLRSAVELIGYDFLASDEAVGHIDDLLFDAEDWKIHFMVVDTRNCQLRKRALVPRACISRVSWGGQVVVADVTGSDVTSGFGVHAGTAPDVVGA